MSNKFKILICKFLFITMVISGCNTPQESQVVITPEIITTTVVEQASPTAEINTQPEETDEPKEALAIEETPMPAIQHKTTPENPVYVQRLPDECNTGFNYKPVGFQVRSPCDNWGTNLLERPVSADMGLFYPYIDILTAQVGKSGDWYYASIDVFGARIADDGVPVTYFFELDINQDGRGDLLLAVTNLSDANWTVNGVRAWRDLNNDVGGTTAVRADSQPGDGYETLIFDQGQGDDSDLVWARHNPNRLEQIEFAFKPDILDGAISFMWWAGAMRGNFYPGDFDLVDSQNEALRYEIDTTCGWVFGHEKGYNLKKCYIPPNPTAKPKESVAEPKVCIQPPQPDPQCWLWDEEECTWKCVY
jgi:hypothetical protein